MKFRTALAAAAVGLAVAPAAGASPRDVPVKDGKVEHRVRTYETEASYTIPGRVPGGVRTEEWTSKDRYHSRVTDLQTGDLVAETFQTGDRVAMWHRDEGNHVSRAPRNRAGRVIMLGHSFAEEAALQREVIFEKGWYERTGENTYVSKPDAPSDGDNTTTLVLNADFTIVRRTTESKLADGGWFRQTEETLVQETLDAAPAGAFASRYAKVAKKRKRMRRR